MIVIEGADNSGKSTFAKSLGLAHFSAGPAPSDRYELLRCLDDQRGRASMPCSQDRLTCISQQVYSEAPEAALLQRELDELVEVPLVVIVYCRPPERTLMDLSSHVVKSYDTEENMERLAKRQVEYVQRNDDLMSKIPHIVYDWTEYSAQENSDIRSLLITSQHSIDEWRKLRDAMRLGKKTF